MTVKLTHSDQIESAPEMQPETVLKELHSLAASPVEVIQKWAFLAILLLFGVFVYLSFQQNARQFEANAKQPEKVIELLERQITQQDAAAKFQTESMRIQAEALKEIQQFAIRVPMEHANADAKLTNITIGMDRFTSSVEKMEADAKALREAVAANTEAIGKLIQIMEAKVATP